MDMAIPAWLTTPRLMLRPLGTGDADALHALVVQPGVRRHLFDGGVLARAEAEAMAAESLRRFDACGAGLWAVYEIARAGRLAGIAGFWRFGNAGRRSSEELVFALDESCWGCGLATEASGAVLGHVREALGWRLARASVDEGNLASARTLARLGFRECGQSVRSGRVLRLFERPLP